MFVSVILSMLIARIRGATVHFYTKTQMESLFGYTCSSIQIIFSRNKRSFPPVCLSSSLESAPLIQRIESSWNCAKCLDQMSYSSEKNYCPGVRTYKHLGPDLQNILRQSYDNAKVTINLRRMSNLQNILQWMESFSWVRFTCNIVISLISLRYAWEKF